MGIFSWFNDFFAGSGSLASNDNQNCIPGINPATGLPMTDCNNTIDVAGNVYGFDNSNIGTDGNQSNPGINPATGLPMIDDSMLDVAGNPFGIDNSNISPTSIGDDDWHNSFDDFSSGSGFDSD